MVRRDDAWTYFVIDADTKAILLGPFDRQSYAFGVANSAAVKRGGRVVDALHHDVNVIASKLREAQARVYELAAACRDRAHELSEAFSTPSIHTDGSERST